MLAQHANRNIIGNPKSAGENNSWKQNQRKAGQRLCEGIPRCFHTWIAEGEPAHNLERKALQGELEEGKTTVSRLSEITTAEGTFEGKYPLKILRLAWCLRLTQRGDLLCMRVKSSGTAPCHMRYFWSIKKKRRGGFASTAI